jgi:hypothetical protein
MAHFAELDESNTVINVVVIHNDVTTIDGVEGEQSGIDFLNDLYPDSGTWMQTSYNTQAGVHELGGTPFRGNYAGSGMLYDESLGAFIHDQPFPSWVLNTTIYLWEAPTPYPDDGKFYEWDEDTTSWVEVTE